MSVTVSYASTVTTAEVLETNVVAAASNAVKTVTHTGYNSSATLNSGSTPPATKCAYFLQALSGGAATIDLTSLTGTNGATVNTNGLKVQVFKAKNMGSNVMTFSEGASNGYELAGNGWTVAVQPGQEFLFYGYDATPDVGGSAKTIDIAGTGSQTAQISIVAG